MAEREIKFRGLKVFQIFSGEERSVWLYGFFLKRGTYGDPGPQAHIFIYENGYEGYRVDASTIGQFTGAMDSEGTEIYEDDIIEFRDGHRGIVVFRRGSFVVQSVENGVLGLLANFSESEIRVIGNRFENPELMEAESKRRAV